ncbi:acyltransferase family protein [Erythrobacter sp. EC-HK427]|uniref:acyltransferase family protein n=1 Tax=Erythrobacter sp. EC-HK427 TaxID=2038396 RepID=UPI00125C073D|nr:heparan-alpha-glucosaminide N-acetyltransferase domain-containing protein [Erythrobacter sp. EC-HK427]VVT12831.1 conserved membrane hypothetical protein [Erythrobacter sp. EC-HK427]
MPTERMRELDVLRGIAVAVMILVTCPGSWAYTYPQMQHVDWNGFSFADFVFPDFLFGVGMALGLTFGASLDPAKNRRKFWGKIARRVAGLVLLGVALNFLYVISGWLGAAPVGPTDEPTWRLPGVLQRIAGAYLIAVLVLLAVGSQRKEGELRLRTLGIIAAIAVILVGYWALMTFVPVPGHGAGLLDKTGNLAAWIDRQVFTPEHMWALGAETWRGAVVYDPEGLLATLPAATNVLFGVLAVSLWRRSESWRIAALAAFGAALIMAALLIDPVFPINKKIWTSSFALLTSGMSMLLLLVVAGLLRTKLAPLLAPLSILGANAILAFSLSIATAAFIAVPFGSGDTPQTIADRGFEFLSQFIADPYLASLAFAFSALAFVFACILPLHRKGIHLRL